MHFKLSASSELTRARNRVCQIAKPSTASFSAQVMRLLHNGNKLRTQEATAANKTSSRSHAILMVNVKQTAKSRATGKGAVKNGRLYMIDLAGSERAANTQVLVLYLFLLLFAVVFFLSVGLRESFLFS